jgi:SAM-dependent methyltransferase
MMDTEQQMHPGTNYEQKHQSEQEPWSYSDRAAEALRHRWICDQAVSGDPNRMGVLDVGCSFGQLSRELFLRGLNLTSMDISETAVIKTQNLLNGLPKKDQQKNAIVLTGSATKMPFADETFQVVLFSDGLIGWELSPENQKLALHEAYRILKNGGVLVTTDYMNSRHFESHLTTLKGSPFRLAQVHYLNDRLWFQMNTNLRHFKKFSFVKSVLKNISVAELLAKISSLMGPKGSKHLAVVLKK